MRRKNGRTPREASAIRPAADAGAVRISARAGTSPAVFRTGHHGSRCDTCQESGRVRVLEGYQNGLPIFRQYCLGCVHQAEVALPAPAPSKSRMRLTTLFTIVGVVVGIIGVFADEVMPQAVAGFGRYQQGGVVIGSLLVFLGLIVRADLLVLSGGFVFIAALFGDSVGLARGDGIGWKQQTVIASGVLCLAISLVRRMSGRSWNPLHRLTAGRDADAAGPV